MSNQSINYQDHDEIVSILPWYVNNTLEGDQRKRVFDHIGQCDECQREVRFLETLNETVNDDANKQHALHADLDKSLASVMERIESNSQKNDAVSPATSGLQAKLADMFKFSTNLSFPQWSLTAMAGLLVAVLGFQLFTGQSAEQYSVLSSPGISSSPMRLSVEMSAAGNHEQMQTLIQQRLEQLGQPIVIDEAANGVYIIVLKNKVGVTELSTLVTQLESEAPFKQIEILP